MGRGRTRTVGHGVREAGPRVHGRGGAPLRHVGEQGRRLALDRGAVLGYVAVVPLHGWSSHVGEIRLIVDPEHRGEGVGTALARHAIIEALRTGLSKLVVEVLATQEYTIEMFRALGFDPGRGNEPGKGPLGRQQLRPGPVAPGCRAGWRHQ